MCPFPHPMDIPLLSRTFTDSTELSKSREGQIKKERRERVLESARARERKTRFQPQLRVWGPMRYLRQESGIKQLGTERLSQSPPPPPAPVPHGVLHSLSSTGCLPESYQIIRILLWADGAGVRVLPGLSTRASRSSLPMAGAECLRSDITHGPL